LYNKDRYSNLPEVHRGGTVVMDQLEREAMDAATAVAKERIKLGLRNPWYFIEWLMAEYLKNKKSA
jgi:hypothetical protein